MTDNTYYLNMAKNVLMEIKRVLWARMRLSVR